MNALIARLCRAAVLTPEDCSALQRIPYTSAVVQAGEEIVQSGQALSHVLVLESGWAIRCRLLSDGRRQIVNFMLPGDCFDLQAALSARSDHAVVALTPVRLRRASVQAFLAAVRANAALASAFWWVALQEEAILREQIVRIGKRGARERVAHLLLELRRRQLAAGLDEAVASQAPVTREVLADALGLSRVHVSRAVAALVNSGLVSVRQRMVTVEDYDGLVALCGFDAEYLRLSGTTMLPEMGMDESSVM